MTLRNVFARKVRLALSAFAIVLGVAFVSGSFIFTDAMGGAFDDIIEGSTADVEIAPQGANDFDSAQDTRLIPAPVADKLRGVPEVGSVHPYNQLQSVFVIARNGKVVGGTGPPGLAFNRTDARSITGKRILTLSKGHYPHGSSQVALDVDTARKAGYAVGDQVKLVTPGDPPTLKATLSGLVQFGSGGLNGATLTVFDEHFMQQAFFGGRHGYSAISLNAAPGVSQKQLRDAVQPLLPHGVVARTGDALVEKNKASLDKFLGFLNTFLLVFAGVSLVVGTYLIINTFSILVAQRSRELALLRALGASRRQVDVSVIIESVFVGLVGSTLGLALGYLLARGLQAFFGTIGLDLSRAAFKVEPRTVVASYVVGLVVTVVAAYLPARRASRIPPVAALRDDVALPESSLRRRVVAGFVLIVVGAAGMVLGFQKNGNAGLTLIGAGMLSVLVGVSLLSPWLGRPLTRLFEIGYRRAFGTIGVLAAQNSIRNPRRTAATASALMIGLTLVTLIATLGHSAAASTAAAVDKTVTSQLVVSNVIQVPFSTSVAKHVRQVDGVSSVSEVRSGGASIGKDGVFVGAVDPRNLGLAVAVPTVKGSLLGLRNGTVAITETAAERHHYRIGDTVPMHFQGGLQRLKVVAILGGSSPLPYQYLVTLRALEKGGIAPLDTLLFVNKDPSADATEVRRGVKAVVKDLPTVTVQDPAEFAQSQKDQIDFFLNFIYGLLGLAIVIALLGIVNTLALSVIERTREVGLLRAVGVSRRQLRRMVRLEAVVVAVLGAVLGIGTGLVFGVALQRAIADQGVDVLAVPWGQLALFVVFAAVAGVLAAVFPARRAARLNVLDAIGTE